MRNKLTYLTPIFVISIFIGCAHQSPDKVSETNPGSVIVDSSDYDKVEAKKLADAQCAKSKRYAKRVYKTNDDSSKYHHFTCVF